MPSQKPKQPTQPQQETIAARTRQIADRVAALPRVVVAAFSSADPIQRMDRIRKAGTEMIVDMQAVLSWIERRRSPETARLLAQQVDGVLRETLECVAMEIPEYVGGKITRHKPGENASPGAWRTGSLSVQSTLVASRLVDWAIDMEKEDELQRKAADDDAAYRPAKEFLNSTNLRTFKALSAFLRKNPQIRTRRPRPQRLEIHAGDMKAAENRRAAAGFAALDAPPEVVQEFLAQTHASKEEIRKGRSAK